MSNSGRKVNYSLRPAKNVERKMMCEFFREANKMYKINQYRYIGFGAFYFTDFTLMHKEFNINKMVSIEKDQTNSARFEFNKPFGCIELCFGESTIMLESQLNWDYNTKDIVWLDYDDILTESKIFDFELCINKVTSGSFVIISFNSTLNEKNEGGRLKDLSNNCGESRIPVGTRETNLDTIESYKVFQKIIFNSVEKALVEKNSKYIEECDKYIAKQIMFFKYKDNAPMLTLGYTIIKNSDLIKYGQCSYESIEFFSSSNEPYRIDVPNFTYKELQAINKNLPSETFDDIALEMPFINKNDINKYCKIYRYFPNYMEIS